RAAHRGDGLVPRAGLAAERGPVLRRAPVRPRLPRRPAHPCDRERGVMRRRTGAEDGGGAPAAATPAIEAIGVEKSFGPLKVLQGITLSVARGEVMCLMGPSGSGKSTFLRCLNQLEVVDRGRILIEGELLGWREEAGRLHE